MPYGRCQTCICPIEKGEPLHRTFHIMFEGYSTAEKAAATLSTSLNQIEDISKAVHNPESTSNPTPFRSLLLFSRLLRTPPIIIFLLLLP